MNNPRIVNHDSNQDELDAQRRANFDAWLRYWHATRDAVQAEDAYAFTSVLAEFNAERHDEAILNTVQIAQAEFSQQEGAYLAVTLATGQRLTQTRDYVEHTEGDMTPASAANMVAMAIARGYETLNFTGCTPEELQMLMAAADRIGVPYNAPEAVNQNNLNAADNDHDDAAPADNDAEEEIDVEAVTAELLERTENNLNQLKRELQEEVFTANMLDNYNDRLNDLQEILDAAQENGSLDLSRLDDNTLSDRYLFLFAETEGEYTTDEQEIVDALIQKVDTALEAVVALQGNDPELDNDAEVALEDIEVDGAEEIEFEEISSDASVSQDSNSITEESLVEKANEAIAHVDRMLALWENDSEKADEAASPIRLARLRQQLEETRDDFIPNKQSDLEKIDAILSDMNTVCANEGEDHILTKFFVSDVQDNLDAGTLIDENATPRSEVLEAEVISEVEVEPVQYNPLQLGMGTPPLEPEVTIVEGNTDEVIVMPQRAGADIIHDGDTVPVMTSPETVAPVTDLPPITSLLTDSDGTNPISEELALKVAHNISQQDMVVKDLPQENLVEPNLVDKDGEPVTDPDFGEQALEVGDSIRTKSGRFRVKKLKTPAAAPGKTS